MRVLFRRNDEALCPMDRDIIDKNEVQHNTL